MYRLMIVEDEKWEREGLLDFIDWSGMGIEIVGCACNGIDGIKMSELFHPQIIITDIKMPKLDGIQMSRNIRTFLPDAKIIILSGYDDFQYAKQTFDFQAFAYILKPVEKRLLEEVLKDAVSVLERENSRKKELDNLKSQWLKYIKSSETNMFLDMLECKTDYNHFCEFAPISRLKISGNKVVAIFSLYFIPEEIKFFDSLSDDNIQEFMNAFGIVLDEGGIVIPCGKPLKEAVVCMDSPAAAEELETKLSRIKDNLKKKYGIEAIVGIGNKAKDLSGASQSYFQAREAISFRFLADYGELLYLSKIKNAKPENRDKARQLYIMSDRIVKKIIYGIQKGDVDESIRFAEDFLAMLKEHKFAGKMLLRSFFADILGGLSIVPDDIKYINMCEAVWDEDKFTADFSNLESFSQTRQYVAWFLRSIAACVGNRKNREENIAKKVIRIIEARYTEELDLDLVSREMNLSPYYIGKIFKRYTGSAFRKYLNDYRINKAKEMLLSGKFKVYDLGGKIGIQNSSYFCALFRSKFGISPGEYRNLLKGMQKGV